jgi:signal transduction histidine kinase
MRGYVTMLPMIGELSSKQKDYVNKILAGIDQMTRLVVDLLSLARIESDVDQLVEDVDFASLVKGVARTFETHATSKGLKLNVDVADNLPMVTGNPTLLRQAASNLLDNAIKYTPNGQVNVRVYQGESHLVLQVQDTGPGISQADQVRLFERFYRVKRRDASNIKGTGLGLAIVKSIVERRHSGRVWVESRLGAGSSFFAVLPIKQTSGTGA